MSAECAICGSDLDFYLNCALCKAEARVKELEAALRDIDMLASTAWADEVSNRRTVGQIARNALKQEQDG